MSKTVVRLIILLLVLGALLSLTVQLRLWESFDWATLTMIQSALPRSVDLPFSIVTFFGSAEITGLIVLALAWRAPRQHRLPIILCFALATFVEFFGKTFIDQPTTPHELLRSVRVFPSFFISPKVNPPFSYPSGHATRSMFIVVLVAWLITATPWKQSTKLALYAALAVIEMVMLLSRVYLAEHWTMDVVGGMISGAAFALLGLTWQIRFWYASRTAPS